MEVTVRERADGSKSSFPLAWGRLASVRELQTHICVPREVVGSIPLELLKKHIDVVLRDAVQ